MYKPQGKKGLFYEEFTRDRLSSMGNPLEAISKVIDFEMFLASLENKLLNTNKKNNAGAKPYDVVLLFEILILQRYDGLVDFGYKKHFRVKHCANEFAKGRTHNQWYKFGGTL